MKRKILIGFLTVIVITLSAFFVASCKKAAKMLQLDDPVITGYDPESYKVSWRFVDHADSYEVTLSDGTDTKTQEVRTNSVQYVATADQFDFTVKAKSRSAFTDSNIVSKTFVKLDSNIELSVSDDGTVSWEGVDGATGYEVAVDNTSAGRVIDTNYSEVSSGRVHSVKVKPVRVDTDTIMYFSSWSKPVSINKLATVQPSKITYSDGFIRWDSIASATSYEVSINNVKYPASENKLEYSAAGESFAVSIQAIGNHTSTYDGAVSEQKSFIYLPTVQNVRVENGVLAWDPVDNATGYQLKLNQNTTPIKVDGTGYNGVSAGTQYAVSVMPTATGANATYFSDWSAAKNVYILSSPVPEWTGADVDGTDAVNAINWNVIEGASGYAYEVVKPGDVTDSGVLGETSNFYSDNFRAAGTYKIRVKATSNSADIYDSQFSSWMTVIRLAAPTVSTSNIISNENSLSEGFTVTFSAIAEANGYALYKNGTKVTTDTRAQFIVNDVVPEDNTREQSVAYHIQSVGRQTGNRIILSSVIDTTSTNSGFTVKVLETPTAPTIADTTYSFTGTANNNGYNVNISGEYHNATGTSLDLANVLKSGNSDVAVCSKGNGHEILASTYSTSIKVHRLTAPFNVKIDTGTSDGVLNFTGDDNALSYTAVFTADNSALTVDTTTNIRQYINETATILFLRSNANYFKDDQHTIYYMTSPASSNYTFYKLTAPSNINFTNENMTWNKPSNLGSSSAYTPTYKIFDASDNTLYNGEFAGTSYPLSSLKEGLYTFKIVAVGDGVNTINSEPSTSRAVRKLATPELTVNTTNFRYEWSSVAATSNYILMIDDNIVSTDTHEPSGKYYYKPTYDTIGNHTVKLYAAGDGGTTTVNSSACEYTQVVGQLTTPAYNYSYSADYYQPDAEITVNITTETNCPNGYYYVIGGASHLDMNTSYSLNPNTSGAIDIYVYARGGSFDSSEIYYLDSRAAATVTLTLLGYPSVSEATVSKDGIISWKQVSGASAYIVNLDIVGKDGNSYTYSYTTVNNTPELDLSKSFTAVNDGGENVNLTFGNIASMTVKLQSKGTLSANTAVTASRTVSSAQVSFGWPTN